MTGLLDLAICTMQVLLAAAGLILIGVLFSRAWGRVERWLDRHIDAALAGPNDPHRRRAARGDDWFSGGAA